MAHNESVGAPALNTNIESGGFDEKRGIEPVPGPAAPTTQKVAADDEDEDEDIDALIEDLESQDGHQVEEEEEETPGGGRTVPEDMLQTDSRVGLTESEVIARRKKYGLNQMKEEKENHFLKFLSFFVGPIQFVMEVSLKNLLHQFIHPPTLPVMFLLLDQTTTQQLHHLSHSFCPLLHSSHPVLRKTGGGRELCAWFFFSFLRGVQSTDST